MALKITNSSEFIDAIGYLIAKQTESDKQNESYQPYVSKESLFRIAKISSSYDTGRPRVVFEGENTETQKRYPYLESYTPAPNDWVIMAKVGNTHVVLGKIQ